MPIYFYGGIISKEWIYELMKSETIQKNNNNNIYYNSYFLLSAHEYSDIRFQRCLIINTKENVILISITLKYDLISKIINENKQYFKIWNGEEYIEYNDELLENKKFEIWPFGIMKTTRKKYLLSVSTSLQKEVQHYKPTNYRRYF